MLGVSDELVLDRLNPGRQCVVDVLGAIWKKEGDVLRPGPFGSS